MEFNELSAKIKFREESRPSDGVLLRYESSLAFMVCDQCELPKPEGGWPSNLAALGHIALHHTRETGHSVAVETWHGAIYGPRIGGKASG